MCLIFIYSSCKDKHYAIRLVYATQCPHRAASLQSYHGTRDTLRHIVPICDYLPLLHTV